jgi:hypothetical protein
MPLLLAYRNQLYHRHRWRTVDRDEHGEIQLCECGEARRKPDEPDEPESRIPGPRKGKDISLTSGGE